jgi:hypothetical protein
VWRRKKEIHTLARLARRGGAERGDGRTTYA